MNKIYSYTQQNKSNITICSGATASPLFSKKASQVSRTAFLSNLVKIHGAQLTRGSFLFICDPLKNTYTSLIYDTLFNPLSDTLVDFLQGIWSKMQTSDKESVFLKSYFEFLKLLAPTLHNHDERAYTKSLERK